MARENKVPYLESVSCRWRSICPPYSRRANTSEIDPTTTHAVIDLMPDQHNVRQRGGTMRLGKYPCVLDIHSKTYQVYGEELIYERHRHRYEFNNDYREELERAGMMLAGTSPDKHIVEMVELVDHPWFVGCQFHPEFKSRPNRPHPLFRGLIAAALNKKKENQ